MQSTALFYAEYGEIVVQTCYAYGNYHPRTLASFTGTQKGSLPLKGLFSCSVSVFSCSHSFQHWSCSKQSITFFFLSFRWRENIFPVYKNNCTLLLTCLNRINPGQKPCLEIFSSKAQSFSRQLALENTAVKHEQLDCDIPNIHHKNEEQGAEVLCSRLRTDTYPSGELNRKGSL